MIEFIEQYLDVFIYLFPLLTQIGIPVGITFLLLLKGSFISSGFEFFSFVFLITWMFVLGDLISYYIGRKHFTKFVRFVLHKDSFKKQFDNLVEKLSVHSFFVIFITRTILVGLAPMSNYAFGYSKFSFRKFLLFIIFGELLYSLMFVGLGYFFSETIEYVFLLFQDFASIIGILVLIYIFIRLLIKYFKKHSLKTRNL